MIDVASKNAHRDAKKFMNSPLGAIFIIIAIVVVIYKWITGTL